MGRGGSSRGSASDYELRRPGFDSRCRWELGSFSLSSLSISYLSISGVSLISSLVEVQHCWSSTIQENEKKRSRLNPHWMRKKIMSITNCHCILTFYKSTQQGLAFGPPVTKDTMLKRSSENTVSAQFRTRGCWVFRANAHLCLATTSCFKTVRAGKLQLPLVSSSERTLNSGQFSSPQFFCFLNTRTKNSLIFPLSFFI